MAQTLSEAFHNIVHAVRRLNIEAEGDTAEFTANSEIPEQKLRRLATLNADTYDTIQNNIVAGIAPYASEQLGGIDIAAVRTSTQAAMVAFRTYMINNLPVPTDNGLDASARSTNEIVTLAGMPTLAAEINALITATEWA